MLRLALIVSLIACSQQPPSMPQPAPQPVAAPAPSLIERFIALTPALGKCEAWGADSKLCHPSATAALWCSAPANGDRPHCEVSLDWTPPAQPPVEIPKAKGGPLKTYPEKK